MMSSALFEKEMDGEPNFEMIAQSLGEPRRELLQALRGTDKSVVNTADIRAKTSVPAGSAIHHLERLVKWNLVREAKHREYHGRGGSHARTWEITERGEDFCDTELDESLSAFISPEEVAAHDQRISAIEDDIERIEDDIDIMGQLIVKVAMETGTMSEEKGQQLLEQRGWDQ